MVIPCALAQEPPDIERAPMREQGCSWV